MTIGQNYLLYFEIAIELGLNPKGLFYYELFKKGKFHPSNGIMFEKFALKVRDFIIDNGLVGKAEKTKAFLNAQTGVKS